MTKQNHTEDLHSTIRSLKQRIAALERGRPLANASVSQGSFEVRTPDGNVIMRVGEIQWGSQTAYGVELLRRNGTRQARFFDTAGGGGYWSLFDEAGHIVCSEDTASGEGLATPYLAYRSMPWSEVLSPPQVTVSASFERLHRIHAQKAQPWVRTLLLVDTDADTSGQVILAQGGVQVSVTLDVGIATNGYFWLDAPVSGAHMDAIYVDVEARRTAGTGNVRVGVAISTGRQS